ncbi:MAG: SprT-like domain-containing protein [Bacteroidales bacterium]|nr:SprT-like domain-containing protein [Bacteroidales bacterium]
MPTRAEAEAVLSRWLPQGAVAPVCAWLVEHNASLRIARHRTSKLGDYRPPQGAQSGHAISVAGDLGKGMFLWVLLHEMAHLENRARHPRSAPHGREWQAEYAALIVTYLDCFDAGVRPLMEACASRLPLKRSLTAEIERRLRETDGGTPLLTVADLEPGTLFRLKARGADIYRADERRRTRWLCTHMASGRRYLVNGAAEVEKVES